MPAIAALREVASSLSRETRDTACFGIGEFAQSMSVSSGDAADFQDRADCLVVFVETGAVKLVAQVGADREQIVAFGFANEMIALSPSSQTPCELRALTDCKLVAFPMEELARTLGKNAETAISLLRQFLTALSRSRERSILLGRKTALERTASFLLDMADRLGVVRGETVDLNLPMSRREIADGLGLTIETISRQLTDLRERDVIRTGGRSQITIMSTPHLCRLAGRSC